MTNNVVSQTAVSKMTAKAWMFEVEASTYKKTDKAQSLADGMLKKVCSLTSTIEDKLRPVVVDAVKSIWDGNGTAEGSAYPLLALLNPEGDYTLTRWASLVKAFAVRCGVRFTTDKDGRQVPYLMKVPAGVDTWEKMKKHIDDLVFDENTVKSAKARKAEKDQAVKDEADKWLANGGRDAAICALVNMSKRTEKPCPDMAQFFLHVACNFELVEQTLAEALKEGKLSKDLPACAQKPKKAKKA